MIKSSQLILSKIVGLERREITYRNLRSIDRECFSQDIRKSELANYDKFESVSALIDCYESTLSGLLEQHAPIKKRVVTLRPAAPWYNDHIRTEKAKRRNWREYGAKTNLRFIGICSLNNANALTG